MLIKWYVVKQKAGCHDGKMLIYSMYAGCTNIGTENLEKQKDVSGVDSKQFAAPIFIRMKERVTQHNDVAA